MAGVVCKQPNLMLLNELLGVIAIELEYTNTSAYINGAAQTMTTNRIGEVNENNAVSSAVCFCIKNTLASLQTCICLLDVPLSRMP